MRGPLVLIFCAVATLMIFFGGTWLYFQALAELMILAAALWAVWRGEIPERNPRLYIIPGLLLLVPVLQLIPLPLPWLVRWSPELGHALADLPKYGIASPEWHCLSYNPYNTEEQLVWLFTLLLAYFVVRRAAQRDPQGTRLFIAGLLALATGVTLYGLYEWRNPDPYILWLPRRFYRGDVAGTYVNHNHYAGMVELILPLGLAWALDRLPELPPAAGPWPRRLREQLRQMMDALPGRLPLLLICGLLIAGDVASHSRGGQISLAIALIVLLLIRFAHTPRKLLAALVVLLVAAGIFVKAVGVDEDQARFDRIQTVASFDSGGRIQNWKATLPLVPKYWLLGTGLGTWEDATLRYQVTGLFDHAHNDYLEFALTGGVPFVMVLFAALAAMSWEALRRSMRKAHGFPAMRTATLGIGIGIAAVLLHSVSDFNLQIPANVLLLSAAAAISSYGDGLRNGLRAGVNPLPYISSACSTAAWAMTGFLSALAVFVAIGGVARNSHRSQAVPDALAGARTLSAAIISSPFDPALWTNYSVQLGVLGSPAAVRAGERAAALAPRDPAINWQAAATSVYMGDRASALRLLRRQLLLQPWDTRQVHDLALAVAGPGGTCLANGAGSAASMDSCLRELIAHRTGGEKDGTR